MTTTNSSAEERERADFALWGNSPEARRISAQILVNLDRQEGKTPVQWVLDVAEGRLPA
jgi:hypothetical protein